MEEEAGEERMEQVIAGTLDVEGETARIQNSRRGSHGWVGERPDFWCSF